MKYEKTETESTLQNTFMRRYSISPLFIIFMVAFVLIDGSFLSLLTVLFSLWHEMWHIIVLKLVGGKVRGLSAVGIGIKLNSDMLGYKQEIAVALAGPLASFFMFIVFLPFALKNEYTMFCAFSNLIIFIINILPVFPLDGGRALYFFMCERVLPFTASKITKCITVIFLLPLFILSVIILIKTGYNLTLMLICLYLFVLFLGVKNI